MKVNLSGWEYKSLWICESLFNWRVELRGLIWLIDEAIRIVN